MNALDLIADRAKQTPTPHPESPDHPSLKLKLKLKPLRGSHPGRACAV